MEVSELRENASKLLGGAMAAHRGKEERVGYPTSTYQKLVDVEYPDGKIYHLWVSISSEDREGDEK
jgi:hypothetical protein